MSAWAKSAEVELNPGWLALLSPQATPAPPHTVLGCPCPPMFRPSVVYKSGKGATYLRVWSGLMCVCLWPLRARVCWGIHICVCRCAGVQEASLTRPCTGSSRPGLSFLSQAMEALAALPKPLPVPEPAFVSFTGGQRLGVGARRGRHCGNSHGILGTRPFKGLGGA